MKASNSLWQKELAGKMPEALAREIDIFETEIALRKQGKLDERLFAETRLRRGVYGQRYDNGQRHNGKTVQEIGLPLRRADQGPQYDVGCAGDAAHQDSRRRTECRSAGNAGRISPRNIPTASRTSPPGRIFSCTTCTSTTRPA